MNVGELIKQLNDYPPDMEIFIRSGNNQYKIQHISFSETGAEVEVDVGDDLADDEAFSEYF